MRYNIDEVIYMKKGILSLSLLAVSILALTSCNAPIKIKSQSGEYSIHSEHQELYLNDVNYNNITKHAAFASLENYANSLPITLSWSGGMSPYTLSISENEDLSDAYQVKISKTKFDFYNPLIGKTYYWNVRHGDNESEIASFSVKDTKMRNITVDGVDNMRDIGGYSLSNGKKIKQGLIYRSAEFNKNNESNLALDITKAGLEMMNRLNIKTDIDLRRNYAKDDKIETSGITSSPLGSDIKYVQAPMHYGGENFLNNSDATVDAMNKASIKLVFETIADPNNYPIVFHCVQGKDRTGCIAYLLEGLLGMKEDDIYRDYLFTNFSNSVGSACKTDDIDRRYGMTIKAVEGETLSNKIYKYLNETLGVDNSKLDAIIANLVID